MAPRSASQAYIAWGLLFLLLPWAPPASAQSGAVGFFTQNGENPPISGVGTDVVILDLFADLGDRDRGPVFVSFYYADHPGTSADIAPQSVLYLKPATAEWSPAPSWCQSTVTVGGVAGWCRVPGSMGQNNQFGTAGGTDEIQMLLNGPGTTVTTPSGSRDGSFRVRLEVEIPNVGGIHPAYLALRVRIPPSPQSQPGASAEVATSVNFRKTFDITAIQLTKLAPTASSFSQQGPVEFVARIGGTKPLAGGDLRFDGTLFPMTLGGRELSRTHEVRPGLHEYQFVARFADGRSLTSGTFLVEAANHQPILTSGGVGPATGTASSTVFSYSVVYTDLLNHAPTMRQLWINGGLAADMSSADTVYDDGAIFHHSTPLGAGNHNFFFLFSDGVGSPVRLPATGAFEGPNVSPASSPSPTTSPTSTTAATTSTSTTPSGPTAPDLTVSAVAVVSRDRASARIQWNVAGPASARSFVEYGPSTEYGSLTEAVLGTGPKQQTVSGLDPNRRYHFRIVAQDDLGRTATSGGDSFVANIDIVLAVVGTEAPSRTSVVVRWSVHGPDDVSSNLEWGTASSLGKTTPAQAGTGLKSAELGDLAHGTTVHFRVAATDPLGQRVTTATQTFVVDAPLQVLDVGDSPLDGSSRLITWRVVGFADAVSLVEYGTSALLGRRTDTVQGAGLKSVRLQDLSPGVAYFYRIIASNQDGHRVDSPVRNFRTGGAATPPTVAEVVIRSGLGFADVSWKVSGDPGVTSRVEYGPTSQYGSFGEVRLGPGAFQEKIHGLTVGATYHLRVTVTGIDGARVHSPDQTLVIPMLAGRALHETGRTVPIPTGVRVGETVFFSFRLPESTREAYLQIVDEATGAVTRIPLTRVVDPATGAVFWVGEGAFRSKGNFAIQTVALDPNGAESIVDVGTVGAADPPGLSATMATIAIGLGAALLLGAGGYTVARRRRAARAAMGGSATGRVVGRPVKPPAPPGPPRANLPRAPARRPPLAPPR